MSLLKSLAAKVENAARKTIHEVRCAAQEVIAELTDTECCWESTPVTCRGCRSTLPVTRGKKVDSRRPDGVGPTVYIFYCRHNIEDSSKQRYEVAFADFPVGSYVGGMVEEGYDCTLEYLRFEGGASKEEARYFCPPCWAAEAEHRCHFAHVNATCEAAGIACKSRYKGDKVRIYEAIRPKAAPNHIARNGRLSLPAAARICDISYGDGTAGDPYDLYMRAKGRTGADPGKDAIVDISGGEGYFDPTVQVLKCDDVGHRVLVAVPSDAALKAAPPGGKGHTVLVAIRGTAVKVLGTILADVQLVLDNLDPESESIVEMRDVVVEEVVGVLRTQYDRLVRAGTAVPAAARRLRVVITGHSLGGYLAQVGRRGGGGSIAAHSGARREALALYLLPTSRLAAKGAGSGCPRDRAFLEHVDVVQCLVFDAPGLSPQDLDRLKQQRSDGLLTVSEVQSMLHAYLSYCNPVNMLGRRRDKRDGAEYMTIRHVATPLYDSSKWTAANAQAAVSRVAAYAFAPVAAPVAAVAAGLTLKTELLATCRYHQLDIIMRGLRQQDWNFRMASWPTLGKGVTVAQKALGSAMKRTVTPSMLSRKNLGLARMVTSSRHGHALTASASYEGYEVLKCDDVGHRVLVAVPSDAALKAAPPGGKGHTVLVAIRGTAVKVLGTILADVQLVLDNLDPESESIVEMRDVVVEEVVGVLRTQYDRLVRAGTAVPAAARRLRVVITGHSLGGYLAQVGRRGGGGSIAAHSGARREALALYLLPTSRLAAKGAGSGCPRDRAFLEHVDVVQCLVFDAPGLSPQDLDRLKQQRSDGLLTVSEVQSMLHAYLSYCNPVNMLGRRRDKRDGAEYMTIRHVATPLYDSSKWTAANAQAAVSRVAAYAFAPVAAPVAAVAAGLTLKTELLATCRYHQLDIIMRGLRQQDWNFRMASWPTLGKGVTVAQKALGSAMKRTVTPSMLSRKNLGLARMVTSSRHGHALTASASYEGLYPISTLLAPLLLFGLLCGLGVWGVVASASRDVVQQKNDARSVALDAAIGFEIQMQQSFTPGVTFQLLVRQRPDWGYWQTHFNDTAQELLARAPAGSLWSLQIQPLGQVMGIWPTRPEDLAQLEPPRDLLADPSRRPDVTASIARHGVVVNGPFLTWQGFMGAFVRFPIYVPDVDASDTFGFRYRENASALPYEQVPASYRDCAQCYNATTREKWWGSAVVVVNYDEVTAGQDAYLAQLRSRGFHYALVKPASSASGNTTAEYVIAQQGGEDLRAADSVTVKVRVIGDEVWLLRVAPAGGFTTTWRDPLIAAVVGLALMFSVLLFLTLTFFKKQRVLLTEMVAANKILEETTQRLEDEKDRMDVLLARQYNLLACLGGNAASRQPSSGLLMHQHKQHPGSEGVAGMDGGLRVTGSGGSSLSAGTSKHAMMARIEEARRSLSVASAACADDTIRVNELLGSGAFGKVHKGVWRGSTVAVKTMILPANMTGQEKREKMAVMEAAISSSLVHPNIVTTYTYFIRPYTEPVHEALVVGPADTHTQMPSSGVGGGDSSLRPGGTGGTRGGSHGTQRSVSGSEGSVHSYEVRLVLEYCDKGSLQDALEQHAFMSTGGDGAGTGALNLAAILETAADVAKAMVHMHAANVLHADLKARNVLLKSTGGGESGRGLMAKVADFGLSTRMERTETHLSGCFHGTLTHMAPEVMLEGRISKAADVYAVLDELERMREELGGDTAAVVVVAPPPTQNKPRSGAASSNGLAAGVLGSRVPSRSGSLVGAGPVATQPPAGLRGHSFKGAAAVNIGRDLGGMVPGSLSSRPNSFSRLSATSLACGRPAGAAGVGGSGGGGGGGASGGGASGFASPLRVLKSGAVLGATYTADGGIVLGTLECMDTSSLMGPGAAAASAAAVAAPGLPSPIGSSSQRGAGSDGSGSGSDSPLQRALSDDIGSAHGGGGGGGGSAVAYGSEPPGQGLGHSAAAHRAMMKKALTQRQLRKLGVRLPAVSRSGLSWSAGSMVSQLPALEEGVERAEESAELVKMTVGSASAGGRCRPDEALSNGAGI
ncbi:hypothetical protein HXX76_005966 [Chlamydomonas incerta]|uniref:Protein kinase domain-containing protein n=1 Tax=Chlamydomonas incerta TaxID=51695 RepID=A0A835W4Z4_CHLIN|nr:hypothetical protein HXX76_005966 [Chlamydomonas incerta]|eukprot:KAG2437309.1 hypothetical protein HXX76_005966 [Chlamydomonas incerta]